MPLTERGIVRPLASTGEPAIYLNIEHKPLAQVRILIHELTEYLVRANNLSLFDDGMPAAYDGEGQAMKLAHKVAVQVEDEYAAAWGLDVFESGFTAAAKLRVLQGANCPPQYRRPRPVTVYVDPDRDESRAIGRRAN
jgi:hypothetical protein